MHILTMGNLLPRRLSAATSPSNRSLCLLKVAWATLTTARKVRAIDPLLCTTSVHTLCRNCVWRNLDHAFDSPPLCPLCRSNLSPYLTYLNTAARQVVRAILARPPAAASILPPFLRGSTRRECENNCCHYLLSLLNTGVWSANSRACHRWLGLLLHTVYCAGGEDI